ncbi:MAG: HD family phosphohydrolase [Nitrospirae bacterium GWC2_56_14]|nr:MAG: HD family phosphohydrolase [Nitrospirae bacterium GWC2_56_14]
MKRDDLNAFKTWFSMYCASFSSDLEEDQKNFDVKRKHTDDVCSNMLVIAQDLELDDQRAMIAEAIALFHDIGRFPQYQQYKTFQDSISVNHAALGAKVLIETAALGNLPKEEQDLIVRAVTLHNVLAIPKELDRNLLQYVKMIRDADKLDIWRVFLEYYAQPKADQATAVGLGLPDIPEYSPEILTNLHQRKLVLLSSLKTLTDFKLLQLAWIFDLNFPASFRIVAQRSYIDRFALTLPKTDDIADAVDAVREYLNEKLKNG